MYLTYLDDSDTRAKIKKWQVVSAVMIDDEAFFAFELMSSVIMDDLLSLLSPEKAENFAEFHACEVYGGYGPFEGVGQERRFLAIRGLLTSIVSLGAKVAYGAIDLERLRKTHYASASPLDAAFRMCVEGVGGWLSARASDAMLEPAMAAKFSALLIVDECNGKDKALLQQSFRSMRGRQFSKRSVSSLPYIHDDMYFGDSRYSVGIQMADLCSYFIARHLTGDAETEHFYKMIEPQIISAPREE